MQIVEEDVTDYPRPPRLERVDWPATIDFAGVTIASAPQVHRVLETYHPPTYYLPPGAFTDGVLIPVARRTMCEWKGVATYFDIAVNGRSAPAAAWTYTKPTSQFADISGHIAVYAEPMDKCTVAGMEVIPQPGNFYGGWVTSNLTGAIKGAPGTTHW